MFIHLWEMISASCQSMAHIAIYICKSFSNTVCLEPIHVFSNNYDKFAQRKLLLSSDVELNSESSDMDAMLSAIQASKNRALNEIRSCCQIQYFVYNYFKCLGISVSMQLSFNRN